jgi:ribonuclease HI
MKNTKLIRVNKESEKEKAEYLDIYIDGAISMKNKTGGIGLVFVDRNTEKQILSHSAKYEYEEVTNNQMELMAFIVALQLCRIMLFTEISQKYKQVTIYSDSAYVVNGYNSHLNKWIARNGLTADGQPVKNLSYWKAVLKMRKVWIYKKKFVVKHIKGHAGEKWNEISDSLAQIQAHGREVNKQKSKLKEKV